MTFTLGFLALKTALFTWLTLDLLLTTIPKSCYPEVNVPCAPIVHLQARLCKAFASLSCFGSAPQWIDRLSINNCWTSATVLEHVAQALSWYMTLTNALEAVVACWRHDLLLVVHHTHSLFKCSVGRLISQRRPRQRLGSSSRVIAYWKRIKLV